MGTARLLSAVIAITFALTSASNFAQGINLVPKNFKASINNFRSPSYTVELQNGAILYSKKNSTNTVHLTITPTAQQWQEFRRALEDLNVWQWQSQFINYDVFDGTAWSFSIEYIDRGLTARGSNGYPDDLGKFSKEIEPTKTFRAYLAAVQRLLGGKDFK